MLFSLHDKALKHPVPVRIKSASGVSKTLYVGPSQKCDDWLAYEKTDGDHATGVCLGLRKDKQKDGWSVMGIGPEMTEPAPAKPAPKPPVPASPPAKPDAKK